MNIWAVDTHVHLHSQAQLPLIVARAQSNLAHAVGQADRVGRADHVGGVQGHDGRKSFAGVLLLADMLGQNSFDRIAVAARSQAAGNWQMYADDGVPIANCEHAETPMLFVGGYQLATRERLEVLALAAAVRPQDGRNVFDSLEETIDLGAIPVLPWAAGKWLGERGRLVRSVLESGRFSGKIAVADNGNRPWIWPQPSLLNYARTRAYPLLKGSDPLPLAGDEQRIGSMGVICPGGEIAHPVAALRRGLLGTPADGQRDSVMPVCFGRAMSPWQFGTLQLGLRMKRAA